MVETMFMVRYLDIEELADRYRDADATVVPFVVNGW